MQCVLLADTNELGTPVLAPRKPLLCDTMFAVFSQPACRSWHQRVTWPAGQNVVAVPVNHRSW